MEAVHEKPQLSDILQDITNKIRQMLSGTAESYYAYRLLPAEKVKSTREIDIALEIALRFHPDQRIAAIDGATTTGVTESLCAVIPPVLTYKDNPKNQTSLSIESAEWILESLSSVAGPLQHCEIEPGSCLLYFECGMVLFLRHGLH